MFIEELELVTADLASQHNYYRDVLELPTDLRGDSLHITAGRTELIFKPAPKDWNGAYHFCFNIPENQMPRAREWIGSRVPLLTDENGTVRFDFDSWNSSSIYFKDPAGNILEFIARHGQKNANNTAFDSRQILQVSEIGLPSKDVIAFANELRVRLGISLYRQEPNATFTPIGDEDALLILPAEGRIWYPNTGVPAKLLPLKIRLAVNARRFEIRALPYEIRMVDAAA